VVSRGGPCLYSKFCIIALSLLDCRNHEDVTGSAAFEEPLTGVKALL
jgi:hypothetical protein